MVGILPHFKYGHLWCVHLVEIGVSLKFIMFRTKQSLKTLVENHVVLHLSKFERLEGASQFVELVYYKDEKRGVCLLIVGDFDYDGAYSVIA